MLRPFRIGDEVRIDTFVGRVVDVQLRATVLKAENGDEVLIPNADVYNGTIINMSRYDLHRQAITVQVPEDIDLGRARAALTQALGAVPGVASDPQPIVVATGLDGAAVTIEARFWVDQRSNSPDVVTTGVIAAARRALEQARVGGKDGSEQGLAKDELPRLHD
jgi:small-conductance mechanosensitive channel